MLSRVRNYTLLLFLCGCLVHCGAPVPPTTPTMQAPVGQQEQPIIGGQPSAQFEAIGALIRSGSPFCTATLITPQLLLTAAHCISGSPSSVQFRIDAAGGQRLIGVQQMIRHPNYVANSQQMTDNDIAVVVLSQKVTNVTPLPVSQSPLTNSQIGQLVRKIGYGYIQTQPQAIYPNSKYMADIPLFQVDSKAFIHWDRQTKKSACHGDSGGPALMQLNGTWMIIGVTSRGHQSQPNPTGRPQTLCNGGTYDCRTDTQYQGFLLQHINNFGGPPSECQPNQSEACYSGPAGTQDVGTCKAGTRTCQSGKWGPCAGESLPAAQENCTDQLDNNCNGQVNEGCAECQPNQTKPCYTGPAGTENIGQCKAGVQSCVNGKWQPCAGDVQPAATEQCGDQVDNNCDGTVDEGCCPEGQSKPCYAGPAGTQDVGACRSGAQTCTQGVWGACTGEVGPQPQESCGNNIDDNCDGAVDEGCVQCQAGQTTKCYDGDVTKLGKGVCRTGLRSCQATGLWGPCVGQVKPLLQELCGDQIDNTCDGQVDEGCPPAGTCQIGTSQPCYSAAQQTAGVGPCKMGQKLCQASGQWGQCLGEITPQAEQPGDAVDNNCNGLIDEAAGPGTFPPNQGPGTQGVWVARGSGCSTLDSATPAPLWAAMGLLLLLVFSRRDSTPPRR